MKSKFYRELALYSTALLFGIKAYGDNASLQERINAAQFEGSVTNLSALAIEVENLWTNDAVLYFQSEQKITEALEPLTRTNSAALQELENQTKNILGKNCPKGAHDANACFKLKFRVAEQFTRVFISAPNFRGAETLAKFLGEVRTTIIANYKFTPMQMNVMPPVAPKGQMIFTGMDPNAISDPVARAAYEKAIDENAQKADENDLQLHTLPEINHTMTLHFFDYTETLLAQSPEAKKQKANLAALAHLTEDEQRRLQ